MRGSALTKAAAISVPWSWVEVSTKALTRYTGLSSGLIGERFGGLDEGLVSRDRSAIREKIKTDRKIRKWFQDIVIPNT
jgi:hypothetical protein